MNPNYKSDNNKDMKDYHKRYFLENSDRIKEKQKQYRQKNKEVIKKRNKKYRLENKNKVKVWRSKEISKRRYNLKVLKYDYSLKDWENTLIYFGNSCCYCGSNEENLEKEHFIALSKGGEFTIKNIIPACKSCNASKRDKDFKEWYKSKDFYCKQKEVKIFSFLSI